MAGTLVVAPSWVGDAVLAEPLLARLRQQAPHAALDVLAPAWAAAVFARIPAVSRTIANPFGHGALGLAARLRLGRTLREARYDRAIVLPNSFKSALVPFFARIPQRTGYTGEARWGLLNDARRLDKIELPLMVERFTALAVPPGARITQPVSPPRLRIDPQTRLQTLATLQLESSRPIAVFAPGAEYGPAKRWPSAHFATVARALGTTHAIWLVGSAKDHAVAAEIDAAAPGLCTNLCGRTDLGQAIDVIASAAFVVTNDSGLMHVAAACDIPLVALFGSSSPQFTPPLSPQARVLRLGLPCSPCFQRECPLGHLNCLRQLAPETVLAAVAEFGQLASPPA